MDIGPFELLGLVGRGGMGEVYRARHARLGEDVALKVVRGATGPRARAALRNEVRAVAALDHPGIVLVHDLDTVDARPWFAMEFIERTLEDLPVPRRWSEVRELLLSLLDALGHAHACVVVHRDLKPANVLLKGHRAVLADFGLAWLADSEVLVHAGTPAYMAPRAVRQRLAPVRALDGPLRPGLCGLRAAQRGSALRQGLPPGSRQLRAASPGRPGRGSPGVAPRAAREVADDALLLRG
ncbi:MAG TPA: serine/threonine-protein kinase [Myxococcota bacterium]|nr:serine/threonine-protein kinase [Myxococcota bacterium]